MPRPHVEFIQVQALVWRPLESVHRAANAFRMLSADPDSGACTALLRYASGASADVAAFDYDEEIFVLDGDITIADMQYAAGDYGLLPAGCARGEIAGEGGAVVLCFADGALTKPVTEPKAGVDPQRTATRNAEFAGATDATIAGDRVGRLLLRPDNALGERTWLLRVRATRDEPFEINGVERHPCAEELYVLEGSLAMPCGTLWPGAYFWRPPGVPHGPTGIRENFLGLFRAREGAFDTEWSAAPGPIDWDPPYAPVLPDGYPRPTGT